MGYGGLWKLLMVVSLLMQIGVWKGYSNESVKQFKVGVAAECFLKRKDITIAICNCVTVIRGSVGFSSVMMKFHIS